MSTSMMTTRTSTRKKSKPNFLALQMANFVHKNTKDYNSEPTDTPSLSCDEDLRALDEANEAAIILDSIASIEPALQKQESKTLELLKQDRLRRIDKERVRALCTAKAKVACPVCRRVVPPPHRVFDRQKRELEFECEVCWKPYPASACATNLRCGHFMCSGCFEISWIADCKTKKRKREEDESLLEETLGSDVEEGNDDDDNEEEDDEEEVEEGDEEDEEEEDEGNDDDDNEALGIGRIL